MNNIKNEALIYPQYQTNRQWGGAYVRYQKGLPLNSIGDWKLGSAVLCKQRLPKLMTVQSVSYLQLCQL